MSLFNETVEADNVSQNAVRVPAFSSHIGFAEHGFRLNVYNSKCVTQTK